MTIFLCPLWVVLTTNAQTAAHTMYLASISDFLFSALTQVSVCYYNSPTLIRQVISYIIISFSGLRRSSQGQKSQGVSYYTSASTTKF